MVLFVYLGPLPQSMPVFAADPAGHSGLDLLALAALSSKPSGATPTVGPYAGLGA